MKRKSMLVMLLVGAMTLLSPLVGEAAEKSRAGGQLYHNEDSTNFFFFQKIPDGKVGEVIDHYIDVMAEAGVTVFLCNTNSRRTNYDSRVWDSYWGEYDPAGPDDQPFLAAVPRDNVAQYRNLIGNMLTVHRQGIDYPARVAQRCRHRGISPWITLRMNDCHYNDIADHPFHGNFWKQHPEFQIQGRNDYFAHCLDYAHPEVRGYYMALILETLERYDIDGLELDFMREPYLFSVGKEAEGAPILSAWIREVRRETEKAAARRGHPIRLGVRIPSRPETASQMGLDAVAWAKEGLIDLLVVTPRWATLEFDMPLDEWRKLLGTSKTTLAGGLEVLYRPFPGGNASHVTPELATGAAVSVLSRGADVVYLFNYFQNGHPAWTPPIYQNTLKAMTSLDTLREKPRAVGITYRDIVGPGESYQAPLPATGKEVSLPLRLGPLPNVPRACEARIGLAASKGSPASAPSVTVNGVPCEPLGDGELDNGQIMVSYRVPGAALAGAEVHKITITAKDQKPLTLQQLEMSLREPAEKKP